MLCASPPPSPEQIEYDKTVRITYAYFLLFSSVFVILTFIVYSLLEDLRNIHGIEYFSIVRNRNQIQILLMLTNIGNRSYHYELSGINDVDVRWHRNCFIDSYRGLFSSCSLLVFRYEESLLNSIYINVIMYF